MKPRKYSFCSEVNDLPRDCSRTGGVMGEAKHQTPNIREEKHQTPNTKHQINPKHQASKTRRRVKKSGLVLGVGCFFGVWSLVYGVSCRFFDPHRAKLQ